MYGIDLFAGAGGMSLGAEMSGVEVIAAIELDPHAGITYAANHPDTSLIQKDITCMDDDEIKGIHTYQDDLILFGGPPCQGFSYSNPRHRKLANSSNWLFLQFLRCVRLLRPAWVVFENVRGLRDTAHGYFLNAVTSSLEALDLHVVGTILDASDFGVPQRRRRYFLVANRTGKPFDMPISNPTPPPSVDDAIRDLPDLENGHAVSEMPYSARQPSAYAKALRNTNAKSHNHLVTRNNAIVIQRYHHIPQGGNWQNIPERLMANYADPARCHTGIYHRLEADQPSVVIGNYRKNMLIHPTQHRGLSVREAARLQSFPDHFRFHGSIGFQQQQVANAVPPLLAKAVFDRIVDCTQ